VSERLLMRAARRLTERDRLILALLWEHRVLTTSHVAALAFGNVTTARHRLAALYELRLLDRFQPRTPAGLADYHYVLDHAGSYVVAADRGADPDALAWTKENALAIMRSQRLAHLVGTNGLFVTLAGTARRHADATLLLWWSERRFAAWLGEQSAGWTAVAQDGGRGWRQPPRPYPDGYGVWTEGGSTVACAVEYDRGTEPLARLTAKLPGYVELAWLLGAPPWTLFAFGSPRREANARAALAGAPVPVATAHDLADPAGPVWLPVDASPALRLRLAGLAHAAPAPAVRPLLDALAVRGARAARRRLSLAESRGGTPPHPEDPDGGAAFRTAFA
jgi:hypothetical protein